MSFLKRFSEPSTWAGLGVLTSIVGVPPGTFQLAQQVVMGIMGLIAVFAKEKAAPDA